MAKKKIAPRCDEKKCCIICKITSDDVFYKGPFLPSLVVNTNDALTKILKSIDDKIKNSGQGGSPAVLERDVISDIDLGGIGELEVLEKGLSYTEFVEKLLVVTFYPSLIPPSLNIVNGGNREVGSSTQTVNTTFNRGSINGSTVGGIWQPNVSQGPRSGIPTYYSIENNPYSTSDLGADVVVNKKTILGLNEIDEISVDYSVGQQPLNSKFGSYGSPLPPGNLTGSTSWVGFYYRTVVVGTFEPTQADIRSSSTRRPDAGLIQVETGTTNTRFDVFVPLGSELVKVVDEDNLNLDITAEFEEQSNFIGLDAGGDAVTYRHYRRLIDNPYPSSSNLLITVT